MTVGLKSKEISDSLLTSITPRLESAGFIRYKPKQFIKLNDDVLLFIQVYAAQNDIYIWYSSYPLCQNDIWLGSGVAAGRFPEEEGKLRADNAEVLKQSIEYVENGLINVFSFLDRRSTMEGISLSIPDNEKVFLLLVKAFCLSSLGRNEEAKRLLMMFIDSGLDLGESRNGAQKLLASISNGTSNDLLEENKRNNIKSLKLVKYFKHREA